HLDLYRLEDPAELRVLDPAGLVEEGVTVVEWGELLLKWLQPDYLEIVIQLPPGQNSREVVIRAQGAIYERLLEGIKNADIGN
ncbi:MAG TPA: tRNA (adenosine(37)-N6)-threonylcarbamoyltransferase complex ATPase subunit type 1 TsaE, partial [Bacillota bacterium]|nr:tRNA (adenosine(37)-N6)-threonylcarbamoyltransferase complex ATPase subunit type 1 TsaE [Bacillota bacterium]